MSSIYLVVQSGYDVPQYELYRTKEAAIAYARENWGGYNEEIDILQIDPEELLIDNISPMEIYARKNPS